MNSCLINAWQLNIAVLVTAVVCIGGVLLARWVINQRDFPGRDTFILMHLASMWWMAMAGLEVASVAPECKMLWATMSWPGIISVPTFWAVFLWQYVGSVRKPLGRRSLLGMILMPLLIWMVVLSNPWHQLFYGPATGPVSAEPGAPIRFEHGPLFYAVAVYVYLFMSFSLGVVLRAALISHGVHRRHYLAFVLVTAVPWSANIAYVGFGFVVFGVDPTPFSFVFTLVAFSWLILGVRLFDLVPVARHLLLEALPDPVIVVDTQWRVIEANQAALKLDGMGAEWQGRRLQDWPVFGSDLQAQLQEQLELREPLLIQTSAEHYFEVRMRPIERLTRHGVLLLGRLLYLRDVTQRQLAKLKLAEALALSEERLRTITSLHEQLREQALCDPLTGLYNRRYLDEMFGRELARARREHSPLSLALIDLDHFKQLNDQHGHLDGDDVLKSVAQHLLVNLRSSDTVFRIGGEEFLLILPGADAREATKRLEAICLGLAQKQIETRSGMRHMTLSAGLALWPEQGNALDELMRAADAALYEAKRAGRNRVCSLLPRVASPAAEAPVLGKG
ncbi:histidine kinase N-terminal 7TM domain-containing diguanylate cyclase [Phytopseudomonas punonensis]|uniref:diguanylate cyclase n=1 Tax=Phytopseudomonas punonensis TaxID=1220495 RepID=A0A1M6YNI2_9GAMM|nr:histidine kinase N-terminal 7TM domain-containing protein [Pseudomonas punonensis]SHL19826.1 diguanylate cyclase (GGDEF) domain-containing protein [Pseudomonas punonensis]